MPALKILFRVGKVVGMALLFFGWLNGAAFAASLRVEGPGFDVSHGKGWFGRENVRYYDALGNHVDAHKGFFHRNTSDLSMFGTRLHQSPRHLSVRDNTGTTMVSQHQTFFHGNDTVINGNSILHSVQGLFPGNAPAQHP